MKSKLLQKYVVLFVMFFYATLSHAQTTITTPYNGGELHPYFFITFSIENTNNYPILITDVQHRHDSSANGTQYTLWYSASSMSGQPNITTSTGWSPIATSSPISAPTGNLTILSGLTFVISAYTTYRFAISLSTGSLAYSGANASPSVFSSGGVILTTNVAGIGAAGTFPNGGISYFDQRAWNGGFTFTYANPCVSPPVPGTTVTSSSSICIADTIELSLNGASFGLGQTYQWQSSPDNVTWTNIPGAVRETEKVVFLDSIWYRCSITCMNSTTYSTPAHVDAIGSSLIGNYTINQLQPSSPTNFQSFNEFFDTLICGGVSGPVIVDVVPGSGPYLERVEIDSYYGLSSVNTITINGNGNTLSYAASGSFDRTTLLLNGTNHLHVDDLKIEATGSTYGWVLQLTNGANHNTFSNCIFETSTSSSSAHFSNVVMSGSLTSAITSGNSGSYNTFDGNTHIGGYYGFTMNGPGISSFNEGNKIINSTFEDFYNYGLYIRSQDAVEISNNDISRATRTTITSLFGIYFSLGITNAKVNANRLHDFFNGNTSSTMGCFPMYLEEATGSAGNENLISNNLIYNIKHLGTVNAINFSGLSNNYWKVYHNTMVIEDPNYSGNRTSRVISISGFSFFIEIKNNILYLDKGTAPHYFIYISNSSTGVDFDNNVYYAPNSTNVIFGYFGFAVNNFNNWQALGLDGNGFVFDPGFFGGFGNNLNRPTSGAIKSIGENLLADVPGDFDGIARANPPDPGAYQFTPLPCTGVYDFVLDTVVPGEATISWTSSSSSWEIEWGPCGFIPGIAMGTSITSVNSNSNYVISGLPKGQCVCVYVREICATGRFGTWGLPFEICTPILYDLEMAEILTPENDICGDENSVILVTVKNAGLLPASNFDVVANFGGDYFGTISTTFTDTILPGNTDSIVIGTFDLKAGRNVEISAYVDWALDSNQTNDTLIEIRKLPPGGPIKIFSDPPALCQNGPIMFFVEAGMSSPDLEWFDINNNLIGTGDSIVIPFVDSSITVMVKADTLPGIFSVYNVGPENNSFGSGSNFTNLSGVSLIVEAHQEVDVVEATIYPDSSGTLDVEIRQLPSQMVVHSFSRSFTISTPGDPVVIPFDITLSPGEYEFGANSSSTVGLFRNDDSASYPYGDPNLFEITGNTFNPSYYYYYYNIGIKSRNCPREDGEYTLQTGSNMPVSDFVFSNTVSLTGDFTFTGNADTVYWDFSGLGSAVGTNASFVFPLANSFLVCATAVTECGTDTYCQWVDVLNIGTEEYNIPNTLQIFPNPNEGRFSLRFTQEQVGDVEIELLDLSGKRVHLEIKKNFVGEYNKNYLFENLRSGSYIISVRSQNGVVNRRVIINK
ncbi:MAG: T9SS type A sorting domain-containing protein [Cryomorphaceae bacterium]|nr:T9SS type A sorting domain-containing protein [Cryomorphaceae bacterium]